MFVHFADGNVTLSLQTVVTVLIALLGGGGLAAWFTIKPQRDSIIAQATKTSVEAVNEVVGTLRDQLVSARGEIARLEGELTAARKFASEDRSRLEEKIVELRGRIDWLEDELDRRKRPPVE